MDERHMRKFPKVLWQSECGRIRVERTLARSVYPVIMKAREGLPWSEETLNVFNTPTQAVEYAKNYLKHLPK